jgi:hypothetical protein
MVEMRIAEIAKTKSLGSWNYQKQFAILRNGQ